MNKLFQLGSAIWFAAQGSGKVDGTEYMSPCRVLLAGMGIDEQLGGYSRHRFGLTLKPCIFLILYNY